MNPPIRIILGPTASGKEKTAVMAAEKLGADIISADSMKIYTGMNIGTATAPTEYQKKVKHWCINIASPHESFSVADYLSNAESVMADLDSKDKEYIFSGGTALYYKALTEGLFDGPSASSELRDKLNLRYETEGAATIHEELKKLDEVSAERIHPNDKKRVIRALEVVLLTGTPISHQQTQFGKLRQDRKIASAGILWDRDVLYRRINKRVDIMLDRGLVNEARELFERKTPLSRQASAAVGYAELFQYFREEIDFDTAVELIKRNSRRLAKSQMTWFRKFNCEWIEMNEDLTADDVSSMVIEIWNRQLL
jgi:tRNA dimethylallyltransferase